MKFRNVFLIAIFSFIGISLHARHLLGAYMTYECLGNNRYEINMHLYRNPSCSNCADFDRNAPISIFSCPTDTDCEDLDQGDEILSLYLGPPVIEEITNKPRRCELGNGIASGSIIQKGTYTLRMDFPIISGKYVIAYQRCCHSEIFSNILFPGDNGATIYTEIPGNVIQKCNSSPQKDFPGAYTVCVDEITELDLSFSDPDGDQLVYYLCSPTRGGGDILGGQLYNSCAGAQPDPICPPPYEPLAFNTGFSSDNPFDSKIGFPIAPSTGILPIQPELISYNYMAVCVDEWRDGERLSTTRVEFVVESDAITPTADYSLEEEIILYPNPASNHLQIQLPNQIHIEKYQIKDLQGRLLTSADFPPFGEIPIHHLPKGIYFIQFKNQEFAFAKKFVVE